jgi:hypothetical protein
LLAAAGLASFLIHGALWLVLPETLASPAAKEKEKERTLAILPAKEIKEEDIPLALLPEEFRPPKPRLVQVNPDAPADIPPETINTGAANQRAAQPDPVSNERSSMPKFDGELEHSNRITNNTPRPLMPNFAQPVPGVPMGKPAKGVPLDIPPQPAQPTQPTPPSPPTPPVAAPTPAEQPPAPPQAAIAPRADTDAPPAPHAALNTKPEAQPDAKATVAQLPTSTKNSRPDGRQAEASVPAPSLIGTADTYEKPPPLPGDVPVLRLPENRPLPKPRHEEEKLPVKPAPPAAPPPSEKTAPDTKPQIAFPDAPAKTDAPPPPAKADTIAKADAPPKPTPPKPTTPTPPTTAAAKPAPPPAPPPIQRANIGDADDFPAPLPRPQIAKAGTVGPLLRNPTGTNEAGTLALDAKYSEFGDYAQRMMEIVQASWWTILQRTNISARGGQVTITYTLCPDGTVRDVVIAESSASRAAAYACKDAIEARAPYDPWTPKMSETLGKEYRSSCTFIYSR